MGNLCAGRRPWVAVALLSALSFALVLPALLDPHALAGDAPVHVRWQAQFAEHVWHGTLYPRWLPDMNTRFGSPAFFFYPPVTQWAGAMFQPLLPGPGFATVRLLLGIWLLSALGGMGAWLWLRALDLSQRSALVGAAVFLLMPYRCFVDLYQRGALPELVGISVFPWLLYGATRLRAGRPGGWALYALSVAALLYCHLPAAVIGLIFSTGYVVALAPLRDWRFLLAAGTATAVGFLVAAACIVPALGLLSFLTDTTAMWGARNQPMNWLLFATPEWSDGLSAVTLALLALALVSGGVMTALAVRVEQPLLRRVVVFLAIAIVAVAFLNTAPSRAFWALQTPLSRIQFPFRLLSIQAVALSGLAAIACQRVVGGKRVGLLVLGLGGLLVVDAGMLAIQHHRNRAYRPINAEILASTIDTSEYVLGRMDVVRARFGGASSYAVTGTAVSRPLLWDSRRIVLQVDAATAATLALRQFAFTGWECQLDGGGWTVATRIPYPLDVPACTVPAGRHRLEARMPATWLETIGNWLTLLGFALVLASLVRSRRATHSTVEQATASPPR